MLKPKKSVEYLSQTGSHLLLLLQVSGLLLEGLDLLVRLLPVKVDVMNVEQVEML